MVSLIPILFIFSYLPISYKNTFNNSDGNGVGFFGYPPRPAPNGTGLKFIKRVWDGYEIFYLNPGRVRVLPHPAPPRPVYI